MSSWLSGLTVSGLTESVKGVTDSVVKAVENVEIPKIDNETLQKLTLTTPELVEERHRLDAEERRKAAVKDMLSNMDVWATRDADRQILVEECKEAILKLSQDDATFFGPYKMPASNVQTSEETEEEELLKEGTPEEIVKDRNPTAAQLEKLDKLSPLPLLLSDFDLDAHVGLIQKLLGVDPKLVERQSNLSGGGARERIFWQNYFFHCAFTRYECGLSVDEIWCEDQAGSDAPTPGETSTATSIAEAIEAEETTIVFNETSAGAGAATTGTSLEAAFVADAPGAAQELAPHSPELENDVASSSTSTPPGFEMVTSSDLTSSVSPGGGTGDPELDELEAEIMKELED
eukprot:CAMPEP_0194046760 /NCGR_PEP_ID=MMETSP0009_2-20130614/22286_1 /TAXON_ID=210454 /ORGANISM="Grammatophora oceanica, Strain CCMP 410" /LENGTH=346 /DNA_ID=CAMNT_0038692167 /DNA_START=84 /DNA_END=1127 /DNA_ORIENTATION=-